MKKELQPIAIYSRKSKYTGKGESVENQVEMCRQHIAALYGQEAADSADVYEDEGYSGGNLERPQFKKMMRDAKELSFRAIVVYRLDRISRNIGDFAGLIEKLQAEHIDFISIREQFDTNSPMGRAMMYICSVFSQLERETIAERIRDNMYELSKTGRWLGGNTPTGYESESVTNITVDGKTKKACKLKVIPEEIQLVKLIYSKFMEFNSLTKTEQYLLVNGYKSKMGNEFTRFAIRALLTNPVYMIADEEAYKFLKDRVNLFSEETEFDGIHGVMAYNRTLQQRGKTQQLKPMEEWIVSVGKHEGVISGSDWVKVQKLLEMNKPLGYRKPRSHTALLSGLLVCGDCGDYMRPKMSQRTNGAGEYTYSYLCARKEKSRSALCKIKNPNGNLLDAMVVDEIKKLAEDKNELMKQLEKNRKQLQGNMEAYDGELTRMKALVAENEASIKSLVNMLPKAAGTAAEAHIIHEIDQLHTQGEKLKQQLQELEALTKQHELADVEFDLMAQMLSSFASNVDAASLEEKRALIRTLVKKVLWDGENVTVYLFGAEGTAVLPDEPLCEDSKCHPLTGALMTGDGVAQSPIWRILDRLSGDLYLLARTRGGQTLYAPLYVWQCALNLPRRFSEAQKFCRRYESEQNPTTADRLRWYRYRHGLMQSQVAQIMGISESAYKNLENGFSATVAFERMDKLAKHYGVSTEELLDDYGRFLLGGQDWCIRKYRASYSLGQKPFARQMGIPIRCLQDWESGRKVVSLKSWEKYFKDRIST